MCDRTALAAEAALDARARRAAGRAGLIARKSRWRAGSIDNYGDFMLIDPYTNCCVGGSRFDLSAEEVIEFCGGRPITKCRAASPKIKRQGGQMFRARDI
jgi:hypothetical protein